MLLPLSKEVLTKRVFSEVVLICTLERVRMWKVCLGYSELKVRLFLLRSIENPEEKLG